METAIDNVKIINEDHARLSKLEEFEYFRKSNSSKLIIKNNEDHRIRCNSLNTSKNRYADVQPRINTRIITKNEQLDDNSDEIGDLNNSAFIR